MDADIVLVRGNDWIGEIIEGVTGSPYSHTAGIVGDKLIEAQGFRPIGFQSLDFYKARADVFTCDILSNAQRQMIVEYIQDEIGGHYDWCLLIWELIRYIFRILLPYKEHKNRICSTLWADAYKAAGVDLCPGIIYPSPGDLGRSPLLRKTGRLNHGFNIKV